LQTTNKNIQVISILIIFFFILFLFFSKRTNGDNTYNLESRTNNPTKYLEIYEKPKDIQNIDISNKDGRTINASKFRGKLSIINIWATWCAPCVEELPALNRFIKFSKTNNKNSKYKIITLSVDIGKSKRVLPFLKKMEISNFPVYYDPKSQILKKLKINRLPTTIFLNLQGEVIASLQGSLSWEVKEMHALLEKIYLN
jgi:thiol-disulfide isomerase/thioredoxin